MHRDTTIFSFLDHAMMQRNTTFSTASSTPISRPNPKPYTPCTLKTLNLQRDTNLFGSQLYFDFAHAEVERLPPILEAKERHFADEVAVRHLEAEQLLSVTISYYQFLSVKSPCFI